ncbi:hypothetical protein [Cellulomonas timonensis]|uniref:hypothetical protein n=1 Tax=Cellulomonas timonensis TaxID=1689271 RepID=UPI00083132B6|nr:hypothetical protein [Cellulomonas timonensis]
MTHTHPRGAPAAGPALREMWRGRSAATAWRRPSDWYHPAVDGLIAAVVADDAPEAASARLGAARSAAGVGIAEAIDDLGCFYRCVDGQEPPLGMIRALCEGWADEQASGIALGSCLDPTSGLPTRDYLATRLVETYAAGRRAGIPAQESHVLLVLDATTPDPAPWSQVARSAAVGSALRDEFGDGQPLAACGPGVFVVLVDRVLLDDAGEAAADGPSPLDRVVTSTLAHVARQAMQLDVQDLVRHPPTMRVELLPDSYEDAVQLLVNLTR